MFSKYLPGLSTRVLVIAVASILLIGFGHIPATSAIVLGVATVLDVCGAGVITFLGSALQALHLIGPDRLEEVMNSHAVDLGEEVVQLAFRMMNRIFELAERAYDHAVLYPALNGVAFLVHFALSAGAHLLAKIRGGASK